MSFSKFKTIEMVREYYPDISDMYKSFIEERVMEVSEHLHKEIDYYLENRGQFSGESGRSQSLIFPILRYIHQKHMDKLSMYVEKKLHLNDEFTGKPDYVFTKYSPSSFITDTVVAIVEAKKDDFDHGHAQCLAELIAAKEIYDRELVYGIVTDGERWDFTKLEGDNYIMNVKRFHFDSLPALLGSLDYFFQLAIKESEKE